MYGVDKTTDNNIARDDNILRPELQDYLGYKPLHYDLSIVPDLEQNNQTITFSGQAKVGEGSTTV